VNKDEALDLALEALEGNTTNPIIDPDQAAIEDQAINAIKQARALDKKAENARELGLDYEPHKGLSEHLAQATNGRVRIDPVTGDVGIGTAPDLQAELDATNRQVEILSDALAESRRQVAAMKAVQEPVFCEYCGGNDDADFGLPTDHCTDCARPQPAAQPAPVQEPVAWICNHYEEGVKNDVDYWQDDIDALPVGTPLYTTPPAAKRQWVGLTSDEIDFLYRISMDAVDSKGWGFLNHERFAEHIEAKLKEKNNG
jgi:hypothetical protein